MKRNFLAITVAGLLSIGSIANAQDGTVQGLRDDAAKGIAKDSNDTTDQIWKKGGLLSINVNQGSLSNWAAGGDRSSLSIASLVNLYAFYKKDKHIWDNTLDMAYGLVSTTSLGTRKSDDRIDFMSKYGYQITPNKWYVGALFNFRTQFADGFAYPENKERVTTSKLFAPAYALVSPNITYQPNDKFSVSMSPATARFVIVGDDSLSNAGAFGVDPGKKLRTEFGAFASATYKNQFGENLSYVGRLDLFSNYLKNPQNVDVYMTNVLLLKATKLITVSFNLDLIYDDDISSVDRDGNPGGPKLQLKQLMGVGLAYRFKN